MTTQGILEYFGALPTLVQLAQTLSSDTPTRHHLTKLVGSQRQMVAATLSRKTDRGALLVLEDRELAFYAANDLELLMPERKVVVFPATGKRAYQIEQVDNANVLQRAEVLNLVIGNLPNQLVIVTYPEALSERVVNRKALIKNTLSISTGHELGMEFVSQVLAEYGFEQTTFVYQPGQFAVRGGILDVFSFSNDYPFRLEFLGDTVESIRSFDPVDQLSVAHHDHVAIIPNIRTHFLADERVSLLEFLPASMLLFVDSIRQTADELDMRLEKTETHYRNIKQETADNTLSTPPAQLLFSARQWKEQAKKFHTLEIGNKAFRPDTAYIEIPANPQPTFRKDFKSLAEHLMGNHASGVQTAIFCENDKQVRRLTEVLSHEAPGVPVSLIQHTLHEGFLDKTLKLACYTDHQIFERYHRFKAKATFERGKALTLKELTELKPGDYVTHVQHGVARFGGLEIIEQGEGITEAVKLHYDGGDIVYVNTNSLYKIAKFSGQGGAEPKLSKLGSGEWERKKAKAKKRVKELAFNLIELYAKRRSTKTQPFSADTYLQQELEASFLYEDTPDQLAATEAVKADMEQCYPMDRLVCGDVGFGKTEIAIRAAFKSVADGKQVAMLVPTTILAMQHYRTFSERFEKFGVRVEYLNRFRAAREQKEVLEKAERGEVDMLIGTHRILSKDVKFKDLGLLIIDEEHKFGVSAKEKLRHKKVDVDTITLTATPIPRTLQYALLGIRDMSIISTPPPNRQPVDTALHPMNHEMVRDAVAYELKRGGQVFFIHHRIKDLEELAAMIKRLVPDARVKYAHGQMEGAAVEEIMLGFVNHEFDVLVSTTIVEAGLDIPNANTIIINNAHQYGLSDLHQMRGRVGRSNRKAFCYMIAPPLHVLSSDCRKRLTALIEFSDLGSGIQIAMRDLDIRGAGDILGPEQTGFINDIGFELYNKVLEEAIDELKAEHFSDVFETEVKPATSSADCQIDTDQQVLIPHAYIPHVAERLAFYRRISEAKTESDLLNISRELMDRFGALPEPVLSLLDTIRIREVACRLGFERILHKQGTLRGHFMGDPKSSFFASETFSRMLGYVKTHNRGIQLKQMNDKLILHVNGVQTVTNLLTRLREMEGEVLCLTNGVADGSF